MDYLKISLPFFRTGLSLLSVISALLGTAVPAKSNDASLDTLQVQDGVKSLIFHRNVLTVTSRSDHFFIIKATDSSYHLTPFRALLSAQKDRPKNILPDGEVSYGGSNIHRAWLSAPTRRYDHGVLGDDIEAGAVSAELRNGDIVTLTLGINAVFEDRTARLVDIDGNGLSEILVVKSYLDKGAAVALLSMMGTSLEMFAESAAIGVPHRWLNPVGVADFDDDGRNEVAVVITPHIGGTLQLYELQNKTLIEDISATGFSNHQMGSRNLNLSVIADFNNDGIPDIALPDASRENLLGITFKGGRKKELFRIPLKAQIITAIRAGDLNGDQRPEIILGIAPDQLIIISPGS